MIPTLHHRTVILEIGLTNAHIVTLFQTHHYLFTPLTSLIILFGALVSLYLRFD